jgi:putative ABC transport system permease protein
VINLLFKNALMKVKKSYGRFLSLIIIIAVGIGFFAGIRASSPNIINSVNTYYENNDFMDFKIVGSMGLDDDDVSALRQLYNISFVKPSYSIDVLSDGKAVRVHAIEENINKPTLIAGRFPLKDNECLADSKAYKVGEILTITSDVNQQLINKEYKVVGTVNSVLYLFKNYGISNIGDGKLTSYIFVPRNNFQMDYYTEIYLKSENPNNQPIYSKEYKGLIKKIEKELINIKESRENARYTAILETAKGNVEDISFENLSQLEKPKWYIFDRTSSPGYSSLEEDTKKVTLIAQVLPVFFIAIVALMSLNTMTRMIDEERGEIGTLTSLGYSNKSILSMYLLYVFTASIIGILGGFFLGSSLIPYIINSTYQSSYILPSLIISYDLMTLFIIMIVTLTLMFLVTYRAVRKELKEKPANLLRPVPIKKGQTILLEKVTFIWKHLSFSWKVTMRNIFRYKKRVFMTIVGIAGCTALLLTGFGIRDSVSGIADLQYSKVMKYDNLLILKNETSTISEELKSFLEKEKISSPTLIKQATYTVDTGSSNININLVVPEEEKSFEKYFVLNSIQDNNTAKLEDSGVVITSKLAEQTGAGVGDTIKITDIENESITLRVSDIAENYIMHYIFMSKESYMKVFDEEVKYNVVVSDHESQDESLLARNLIDSNLFSSVNFTTDGLNTFNLLVSSLNNVIVMIIVIASILALIVLFNLTSINISERTREIATLKVLGFFDNEVNKYIYRETIILTFISIAVGLFGGIFLHRYVIGIIEVDSTVFLKHINLLSYVWAILITVFFTIVVQFFTYFKLKKINMIESLKSVE